RPPAQPANQFQATLVYGAGSGSSIPILKAQVTHLAGPTLAGSGILIYLYSSSHPNAFGAPYHLTNGLNGSSVWTLGQVWSLDLTSKALTTPDNITISIVTTTQLLFRVTLPGSNPNIPPQFINTGIVPVAPAIGQSFTVFAQIVGNNLNLNSVYVNVSQLPGASGALLQPIVMTFSATSGLWTYTVPGGITTSSGQFYLFVNATNSANQPNSVAIPVTIGTGAVSQSNVLLSINPTPPVDGTPGTLTALVTNPGSAGGAVNVTFRVGAALIGTTTGSVGAGATNSFSISWTPSGPGIVSLSAVANVSGGGTVSGTLNATVFPDILFIAHNVAAGTSKAYNESAYLAEELTSAGVPFVQQFYACNVALPTAAAMGAYDLVIIDFGSSNAAPCNVVPSTTEQGKISGAAATASVWLVGADAFIATPCNSYSSSYYAVFGIKWTAGSTCNTLVTSATAATWVPSAANGVRSDGIGSLTINKTLQGSAAFEPYAYFALGVSGGGSSFLTTGAHVVGVWRTSGALRFAAIATDPALIADVLPNGNSWISGGAGTAITYNMANYLAGFASATSPGRALQDYGIGGISVWGTSHTAKTTVYVPLRTNGPSAGILTATLYINGSVALFNGVPVSATLVVGGNGAMSYATLVWQAPGAASYTFSVVLTESTADLFSPNNQIPATILNQPIVIA
ncbi:MAG: hypothetical protein L3K17_10720, partial [Thermoplasmata archaeon]|nr:hypothetical protein [Thermoplasmata archaeon]